MSAAGKHRPTTFFDIPAELRVAIYANVFEDIVALPRNRRNPPPPKTRFPTYTSLLLTNRQVRDEARDLFRDDYKHRIFFFVVGMQNLLNAVQARGAFPVLEREIIFASVYVVQTASVHSATVLCTKSPLCLCCVPRRIYVL